MALVNENGKQFVIDDKTGLVTEARVESQEELDAIQDEFRLHDRVEAAGKTGSIISVIPNIYGLAYGVRFDDGGIDEFADTQLHRTSVVAKTFSKPTGEVYDRFAAYVELPVFTNEEIDTKEKEARWLNVKASALRSSTKLSMTEQNDLSKIVLMTGSDLEDLKLIRVAGDREENAKYLSSFNKYAISDDIGGMGGTIGLSGDASWLDTAYDGMEVVETTSADLALRATEVVTQLSRTQLEDDDFMTQVASFQHEYLQNDDGREKQFETYLAAARKDRLKELPLTEKKSSVYDGLEDVDDSALYL